MFHGKYFSNMSLLKRIKWDFRKDKQEYRVDKSLEFEDKDAFLKAMLVLPELESDNPLLNYTFLNSLASGANAQVYILKHKKSKKVVAAKFVSSKKDQFGEKVLWPTLKHRNILRLIEKISVSDAVVYIMPLMQHTIYEHFRENEIKFAQTVPWLCDVLQGLDYLHKNEMCHLDLSPCNVLLDKHMKAVICDFDWSFQTDKLITFSRTANFVTPPEGCGPQNQEITFDGIAFDIWLFAMLVLQICSRFNITTLYRIIEHMENWEQEMYPTLFHLLQEDLFFDDMKFIYSDKTLSTKNLGLTHNLIRGCLRRNPKDRPSTSTLLEHGLWSKKNKILEIDDMWISDEKILGSLRNNSEDKPKKSPLLKHMYGICQFPLHSLISREMERSGIEKHLMEMSQIVEELPFIDADDDFDSEDKLISQDSEIANKGIRIEDVIRFLKVQGLEVHLVVENL